jgi:ATP-dependent Clp protease ATP-binding subunit ClpC
MSREITFTLPMVELKSRSGHRVVMPPGFADTLQLEMSAQQAAEQLRRAAQQHLLQQGEYLDFLRFSAPRDYRLDRFTVEIVADPKGDGFAPQQLELDFVHWPIQGSRLGIVPVVGVGAAAASLDGLVDQLRESVKLYLVRAKRTRSLRDLVALQWYQPAKVVPVVVDALFHTPKELDALQRGEEEPLLPKTARPMSRPLLPAFGMDRQVEELRRSLQGDFRQSVLVIGPPGSGKSALIGEYLRSSSLPPKDVPWRTGAARMLQVLTELGGWQYRLGLWCREVADTGAVVHVGPMAELFEVGQYSGSDVSLADALRDPIQRGEVTLIGEATVEQLERMDRRSPGFGDLFVRIDLGDRRPAEQDRIILRAAERLAEHHGVALAEGVVHKLVALQRRYSPYSGFPGKSIRFLESLLIAARDRDSTRPGAVGGAPRRRRRRQERPATRQRLSERDVVAAYCRESGLPAFLVDDSVPLDADELARFFDRAIIGQERAKRAVRETLLAVKAGLHRSGRPIAGFLFVGPTGTGKTQLAKTLARFLFGAEERMLRFDMSEYSDPWSVSRLIHGGEASLVTRVRQTPFAVLLLDEIEKADPSFNDLLLQILGDGRLTDDRGEVANFCSAIVIMTSNIGAADWIRPPIAFAATPASDPDDQVIGHFEHSVKRHFRPELYNRIDRIVPFTALDTGGRARVVRLELEALAANPGLSGQGHRLEYDENLCTHLARLPLDTRYGARAIQRLLDREVIRPLSTELAALPDQPHRVAVRSDGAVIAFEARPMDDAKSRGGVLQQVVEGLSDCRRGLQRMEQSGRWLGLLSRLDRVESRKRRNRQRFWSDPRQVALQRDLGGFVERQGTLRERSLHLEQQGIEGLLAGGGPQQGLQQALDELLAERLRHLTELLAYLEPQLNRALLLVYGVEPYLSAWADGYRELVGAFDPAARPVYLYRRAQRDDPPLPGLIADIDQPDPEECWQLYSRGHERLGQAAALGFLASQPCIAHYLAQEAGIVSYAVAGQKDARLSVELFGGEPEVYRPPAGIYRRKFYERRKPVRRIRYAHSVEILDTRGAVVDTLPWGEYVRQRGEQGEARIVAALDSEQPS